MVHINQNTTVWYLRTHQSRPTGPENKNVWNFQEKMDKSVKSEWAALHDMKYSTTPIIHLINDKGGSDNRKFGELD
jgi:hypothetical protein